MPAPTRNPLTATVLSKVRPTDKPQEFRSQNVRGLVLRVQPSGVMTFYCQVDRNRRVRLGDAKVMTLTMAEAAARQMLLEGPPPTHGNGTLGEFVTASYAPHKRASEVRRIESVFADLLPLRLTEVTHARVEAWRAAQATAPATVNRNLVSLRAVLALAVRVGALTEHPLRTMWALPVAQGTPRHLTRTEYHAMRTLPAIAVDEMVGTGILLHPNDWADLQIIKSTDSGEYLLGSPGQTTAPSLWGVPVVASTAITEGTFLVGDWGIGAQVWDREQTTVQVSFEHSDNFTRTWQPSWSKSGWR